MLPKNFLDKIKIFSFYPEESKEQAQQLFLELKKHDIHPSKINWSNVLRDWKITLINLGLAKEVISSEYPFDVELHFLGWEYELENIIQQ